MKRLAQFGDQQLGKRLTNFIALGLVEGGLAEVRAWLPITGLVRAVVREPRRVVRCRSRHKAGTKARPTEIELTQLKDRDHKSVELNQNKQLRLAKLAELAPNKKGVSPVEHFQHLLSLYKGAAVTVRCLQAWYEHGFSSWDHLLHMVVRFYDQENKSATVSYLLRRGANTNFLLYGVSTLARAFEAVKNADGEAEQEKSIAIFLLLMSVGRSAHNQVTSAKGVITRRASGVQRKAVDRAISHAHAWQKPSAVTLVLEQLHARGVPVAKMLICEKELRDYSIRQELASQQLRLQLRLLSSGARIKSNGSGLVAAAAGGL
jgi:hypothetical protein